jgi:large subunit ribosomal protein L6e
VVLVNNLGQGVLLVTGPFKLNGVPLRRVNARYVIATSTKIDFHHVDKAHVKKVSEHDYFARDPSEKKKGEEAFFKQGEKPEVSTTIDDNEFILICGQKKELSGSRVDDQKHVDKSILAAIKKVPFLEAYLGSSFSLRKGDKPHQMVF